MAGVGLKGRAMAERGEDGRKNEGGAVAAAAESAEEEGSVARERYMVCEMCGAAIDLREEFSEALAELGEGGDVRWVFCSRACLQRHILEECDAEDVEGILASILRL